MSDQSLLPRRIVKETQRLLSEPGTRTPGSTTRTRAAAYTPLLCAAAPGISATPYADNLRYFNVIIQGPTQSAYEGGIFKLELFLTEDYPMAPPKVRRAGEPAAHERAPGSRRAPSRTRHHERGV